MFGNDNISAVPVDDIYASQANLQGNSFQNPVNPANMNPGWGIDPNLLSPSYSANYRPEYSGPQGYNNYGRVGFFKAASNLNPMADDTMWGNPYNNSRRSVESLVDRPADATMWGVQRIATPVAAYAAGRYVSSKLGLGWAAGSRMGAGLGGGFASAFGAGAPASGGVRATASMVQGAFRTGGVRAGMSAIGSIGVGGATNLAARGMMGAALGASAYLAAPLLIGQALITGAEKGIIDPYINTRKNSQNLQRNFSGITFGDSQGNAVTKQGLGYEESYKMAQSLTHQGISDMTFSNGDYSRGADAIGRSGLLDNVNAGGITKAIKQNMEQVKLIMSVANMPELKDAVEQLAKLQTMGASTNGGVGSNAASTMRTLGGLSSIAGASVQKLMNTVGAQGGYMYQANGMTPYMGQIAAAGIYSSFSAGKRMGLLSAEQESRLGGLDGATQASMTGQINASQTMFNKMALYNKYLGGGRGAYGQNSNSVDITSSFGLSMAQDPMGTYGSLLLHEGQMRNQQLKEGTKGIQDQLMARVVGNHPELIDKKTGKISAEKATPILMGMGLGINEIQALFTQMSIEQDGSTADMRHRALDVSARKQKTEYISQEGIYGGPFGTPIYAMNKAGRAITNWVSKYAVDPVTSTIGSATDSVVRTYDKVMYGSTITSGADITRKDPSLNLFARTDEGSHGKVLETMNRLAKQGDGAAVAYFKEKDSAKRSGMLGDMLKKGAFGSELQTFYTNSGDISENIDRLSELDKEASSAKREDNTQALEAAKRVQAKIASGKLSSVPSRFDFNFEQDEDVLAFRKARGADISKKTNGSRGGQLREEISELLEQEKNSKTNGVTGLNDEKFSDDATRITGSTMADKLRTLDIANKIIEARMSGKISESDDETKLGSNKHMADLSKITGLKGASLLKYADEIYKKGAENGWNSIASSVGGHDKGKLYSEKNQTEYDAAIKAGNTKLASDIETRDASEQKGVSSNKLANAKKLTTEQVYGFDAIQKDLDTQHKKLNEQVKSGVIDFTTWKASAAAIDMGEAVRKFGEHVDKMGKNVDDKGRTPAPGTKLGIFGPEVVPGGLLDRFTRKDVNSSQGNPGGKK